MGLQRVRDDLATKQQQQTNNEIESYSVMSDSLWPHGLYSPWNSLGQNTGVGILSLLQGILPTQGSNPGLPHRRQILHQLSYQGSPSGAKASRIGANSAIPHLTSDRPCIFFRMSQGDRPCIFIV